MVKMSCFYSSHALEVDSYLLRKKSLQGPHTLEMMNILKRINENNIPPWNFVLFVVVFLQFCCFQSLLARKCDLLSSATYNTESNNVHLIDHFWNTVPYLLIMKYKIRLYEVTTFNIFVVA